MRKAVVRLQSLRFLSSTSDRQSPRLLLLPHQFQGEAITPDIIMPKRKVSRSTACVQYVSDLTSPPAFPSSSVCVLRCASPPLSAGGAHLAAPPIITMSDPGTSFYNHSAAGCRGGVRDPHPPPPLHHWPCSMTTHGKSREV